MKKFMTLALIALWHEQSPKHYTIRLQRKK